MLAIRGMFWIDLGVMLMTAMGGVALGLVISSLVADPKTAANIVPLVLIPQIIMGGALIKRGHEPQPGVGLYFQPLVL